MIIVDSALARHVAAGKPPIRVGMIGAGFMASGVVLQISTAYRDTIRIVAIANRTPKKAVAAYADGGPGRAAICDSARGARPRHRGRPAGGHRGPDAGGDQPAVDVLLEVTGAVEEAIAPGPRRDRARQARAR